MSAILILTTNDAKLAAEWDRQLPQPAFVAPNAEMLRRELAQDGARVWVKDLADPRSLLPAHTDTVVVIVGQPHSVPFEQARLAGQARFFLSYEESRTQLQEILRTASEIAEKNAIIRTLQARGSRPPMLPVREPAPVAAVPVTDDLNFIEAAIEHLEDRTRVLEEFRRAAQSFLRASRVTLFFRTENGFAADRHGWTCPAFSLLVRQMEDFPCIIDLDDWVGTADPATESYIRQQMHMWGARLLLPLFEAGRLAGWAAYGPRADGRPYDARDRHQALQLGRLLERCLEKAHRLADFARTAELDALRAKYLPGVRLLGPDAPADPTLPPEIRALTGEVRRTGRTARLSASPTTRFRAEAGPVPETGGFWARWEDAAPELAERAAAAEYERLKLFREFGLTLSHELGGPLTSFSTFLQLCQQQGATPELIAEFNAQLARDGDKLHDLTRVLHLMQEFMTGNVVRIDLGVLANKLTLPGAMRVEPNEMAPVIYGNEPMLRFALQTVVDAVARNRTEADGTLTIHVKRRGEGENETGLFVMSGRKLLLEGFIELGRGTMPVHPMLGVFLAREIIRWHNGSLEGGQGLTGSEVHIAIRSRVPSLPPFALPPRPGAEGGVTLEPRQSDLPSS